jgi:hypothetical protein
MCGRLPDTVQPGANDLYAIMLALDVCAKRLETGNQPVIMLVDGQICNLCCAACNGIQHQGTVSNKPVAWDGYRASQTARGLDRDARHSYSGEVINL